MKKKRHFRSRKIRENPDESKIIRYKNFISTMAESVVTSIDLNIKSKKLFMRKSLKSDCEIRALVTRPVDIKIVPWH